MRMMTVVCDYLKNYFTKPENVVCMRVTIANGQIQEPPEGLLDGRYFRIVGSALNDGVHRFGEADDILKDEMFEGEIWLMNVPAHFEDLIGEIEEYQASPQSKASSFSSESFNGYSYSKPTNADGTVANDWRKVFASRLSAYRRIFP